VTPAFFLSVLSAEQGRLAWNSAFSTIIGIYKCEEHNPHIIYTPCTTAARVLSSRPLPSCRQGWRARTAQHADTLQPYYTDLKARVRGASLGRKIRDT